MKKLLILCTLFAGIFSACEKDNFVENTPYSVIAEGDPSFSYVKFLNMTPGSPSVNFFVNDVKISGVYNTASTDNGYGYSGLFPSLGYAAINPGSNVLKANITGSAVADAGLNVLTATSDFAAGKYYSIFTTGVYDTTAKKIPSSLVIEDIEPALDTAKIFLRVINLYAGGPNIDLLQAGTNQKLISNVSFNAASAFVEIPNPGKENTYNLNLSGSDALLKASILKLTLTKGRAYTFIIRGVDGSVTFPLAATFYTTFIK
jgi:hypothetical protein